MMVFNRGLGLAIGLGVLGLSGMAAAQENLDQGKTPAQLFASDCAICHKSPQGLAKAGGILGLDSFLREHYTASRESATAIANYLQAFANAPAAPVRRATETTKKGTGKAGAKGDDKAKTTEKTSGDKKTETKKSGMTLPGDNTPPEAKTTDKPTETKSSEPKASDAKPSESKPSESKPSETKASESKASESKPAESKPAESKPAEAKASEPKASDSKDSEQKPAQTPKSE